MEWNTRMTYNLVISCKGQKWHAGTGRGGGGGAEYFATTDACCQ